jgi:hypothetical protein
VEVFELFFGEAGIAAVEGVALAGSAVLDEAGAEGGAAVAGQVFGAGEDAEGIGEVAALEAAGGGFTEVAGEFRGFAVALVGAAPADVAGDGDAGGEGPMDARGADFFGGDAGDLFDGEFRQVG